MREETKKPIYLTLFAVFASVFFLLRNNVYIIDDLIYHFLEEPRSEYYYGTWLMPLQHIIMYLLPFKLEINLQDWAFICGTTIKAATITFMMFFFLKTFLTEKISRKKACALTFSVFLLFFCLLGQKNFADFIIMSGFFRFIIPSSLLICSLCLIFRHFSGSKTNFFFLLPLSFFTAWSSEITAGILLVCALVLLIYKETKAKEMKELFAPLLILICTISGTLILVCSTGFNYHMSDKLGENTVSFSSVLGNLRWFTKVFITSLITKYSLFWLIALLLIRYNIKKGETKYNIFGLSVLFGVLFFGFSLIIMGKTNYDGGFWIEHRDIYSVFIPSMLYAISVLALPFIRNNNENKWFKTTFISLFSVLLIFSLYYSNKLEKELWAIKDYTYLRDKIRLFYFYKGQHPIYPMSTHLRLADKHIVGIRNKDNNSDKYFDENYIKENSDGYSTMDKYYYPLNYGVKIEGDIQPKFLSHKDGLKIFTQNGGSYSEVLKRKYRFKDLNNKDFVLNNL